MFVSRIHWSNCVDYVFAWHVSSFSPSGGATRNFSVFFYVFFTLILNWWPTGISYRSSNSSSKPKLRVSCICYSINWLFSEITFDDENIYVFYFHAPFALLISVNIGDHSVYDFIMKCLFKRDWSRKFIAAILVQEMVFWNSLYTRSFLHDELVFNFDRLVGRGLFFDQNGFMLAHPDWYVLR